MGVIVDVTRSCLSQEHLTFMSLMIISKVCSIHVSDKYSEVAQAGARFACVRPIKSI